MLLAGNRRRYSLEGLAREGEDQDLFRNAAPTHFPLLQVGGGGEDLQELQFESEEAAFPDPSKGWAAPFPRASRGKQEIGLSGHDCPKGLKTIPLDNKCLRNLSFPKNPVTPNHFTLDRLRKRTGPSTSEGALVCHYKW
ncbi:hypothetical protein E2I00_017911 [Balaenoptera physalus]|uniref:Uncharacterized protein n=1 Tax=Balaenoptera physalus TaxID=9770 RepID=A0A6A1QGD4_BALPH|nr:hypothetical protein E2I00_017911 [Balaenoptera physalus]